ncbi:hypothetical protein BCH_02535 [Brucella sp. 191011898]|nr:hypothetical protein BCH_02535 [Brucella sp. 191011898]
MARHHRALEGHRDTIGQPQAVKPHDTGIHTDAEPESLIRRRLVDPVRHHARAGLLAARNHILREGGEPPQMLADAHWPFSNEGAAAAPRFHKALGQKFLIGLAHGDAADAQLLRKVAFRRKPHCGRKLPFLDQFAQNPREAAIERPRKLRIAQPAPFNGIDQSGSIHTRYNRTDIEPIASDVFMKMPARRRAFLISSTLIRL